MPNTPSFNGTAPLPRNLLDALDEGGFSTADIARRVGIDPSALTVGLTRLQADRFLCAAWDTVGNPAVGLLAGSKLRPERLGISGLAAMTCDTLGDALERKSRFNRLIWGNDYTLHRSEAEFDLVVRNHAVTRPYGAAQVDLELSSLLAFARYFTGQQVVPLRVALVQQTPVYHAMYAAYFNCPVAFGQPADRIVFRTADAQLPLCSACAPAAAALDSAAQAALKALDASDLVHQVRQRLGRTLHDGEPTLAQVASDLLMSERTLQRRLSDEGLSFSRVLDEVRRDLAQHRLRATTDHIGELAYLLGFADTNSFYRAFKRWTGTTPEAFRLRA